MFDKGLEGSTAARTDTTTVQLISMEVLVGARRSERVITSEMEPYESHLTSEVIRTLKGAIRRLASL